MNPLVSIIIPVYNVEDYLHDCFESVINQSYKNIEIILVNDGSTDSSLEICRNLKEKYPNIKLIDKSNGGLSSARNAGIENATGDFLTFVDSDDIIDKVMIEKMVELAITFKCQIAKIGIKRIYNDDPCVPNISNHNEILTPVQALHKIYDPSARIITICGKLFAKELFLNFRFPEGLYFEDEYSTPRLFWDSNKVAVNHSDFYYYMQRDNDSIVRGAWNDKKIHDSCFAIEDRIKFFEKIGNKKLIIKAKIDFFYKLIILLDKAVSFELKDSKILLEKKLEQFKKQNSIIYAYLKTKQRVYTILKGSSK